MKQFCAFIILLAAFCGCTGGGQYNEMLQRLDALNKLNRADSVLTATERDEAQALANYFDRHGTPNDQLLAHYLLGRCYADMHEAPMAIDSYQEAISRADTLSPDCDFAQLSRVYGQSASIFYQQGLYQNQLEYTDLSIINAWKGKDTLAALICYAKKGAVYDQLQMKDSAILIYMDAIKQLKAYNYNKVAAGFSGLLAFELIDKGKTMQAIPYLQDYEQNSGYFDSIGNIVNGREIYYYFKGLYYLKMNQLDSAEYYFRIELRTGKDFNNQNAGSSGLAQLFKQKHRADSSAKYFEDSYAMNDSAFAHKTTHEIEQAKAMYDYSRQQEVAQQEELRAQKNARFFWIAVALVLTLLLCSSFLFLKYQEKKKIQKYQAEKLKDLQTSYITAQNELEKLRNSEDLTTLVADKERQLQQLEEKISLYEQREFGLKRDEIEATIRKEKVYKDFMRHVNRGSKPTDNEWEAIEQLMAKSLPSFYHLVSVKRHELNDKEYRTCFALRLKVSSSQTANLLGLSPSSLTIIRKALLKKVFNVEGSATDFDNRLTRYY